MAIKAVIKTKTPCEIVLTTTVDVADVRAAYERTFDRYSRVVELPGFRAGKAPRTLVEEQFRTQFEKTTVEDIIAGVVNAVVKKHNLTPITAPSLEKEVRFPREGVLSFAVEFEIEPTITLKDYKGIALVKRAVAVTPEDVDKTLEALRNQHATFGDPPEDRAAVFGDWLIVDYAGQVDGTEVLKRADAWIEVSAGSRIPLPGFGEHLAGMKKGDTQEIAITAPSDYYKSELAGKSISFTVTCKQIQERKLPELDLAFVQKVNPNLASLEALRDDILKNHQAYAEAMEQRRLRDLAAEALVRAHNIALPPTVLQSRVRRLMQDEVRRRLQGGAKEEDVKSQFEEINKQMSEIAAMQLAAEYILRAIADKEQLTAVFDDIKPQLEEYAASFRRDIAWVQRMFEREGYLPGLYEEARRNKALDLVVANASITVQN